MLAGGVTTRLDNALVTKFPDPIDLQNDIFKPGKTEAFKQALVAALQSRNLWSVVSTTAPTEESIAAQNPLAARDDVVTALVQVLDTRQRQATQLATLLPGLIVNTSLTYMQNTQLTSLISRGMGVHIYCFIMESIDLRQGKVQDKLRQRFDDKF